LIISLMQPDSKITYKPYVNSNFVILSSNNPRDRIWDFYK